MKKPLPQYETVLPVATLERIRLLIQEHGEARTVELIGCSRHAIPRVLSGLPVRRGTVALISAGVMRIAPSDDKG